MRLFTYFIILLLAFLGISFACLNAELVHVNYYIGSMDIPLSLLLVFVFALGSLACLVVGSFFVLSYKRRIRNLRKEINIAQQEIVNLRALPLSDKH